MVKTHVQRGPDLETIVAEDTRGEGTEVGAKALTLRQMFIIYFTFCCNGNIDSN